MGKKRKPLGGSWGGSADHRAKQRDHETVRLANLALDALPVDGPRLRKLAAVRGLVTTETRARSWPRLLGLPAVEALPPGYSESSRQEHRDTSTVHCDVLRSMWSFTPGWSDGERDVARAALQRLLTAVVVAHPGSVHYYQGLHDVASVLLLVAGEARAYRMLERLALHHLKDCTKPDLQPVMESLRLLLPLLGAVDEELCAFIEDAGVQPFFALSWLMTWFAHDVDNLADACRLFDLFLACSPLMPLYVGVASMVDQRERIMAVEPDHGMVHQALSRLKILGGALSADELAQRAVALHREHPPDALEAAAGVDLDPGSAAKSFPFEWQEEVPRGGGGRGWLAMPFRRKGRIECSLGAAGACRGVKVAGLAGAAARRRAGGGGGGRGVTKGGRGRRWWYGRAAAAGAAGIAVAAAAVAAGGDFTTLSVEGILIGLGLA